MADDVIKEYLLALGWKIDKASEQRFNNAVGTTTKTVAALGASLTAAATSIYATVIKIASGLDEIYFSAQRSNTSVSNVRAYAYALSQLGVAGNAAQATIEGIARAIRTNPGNESLLRSLGVQTRDANGGLRDTVDIIVDLDKQLSKKPQYIASQYAAALGIDEGTFNAIRGQAAKIQEGIAAHRKLAAEMGVNPDKAAKDANALMTTVRAFQAQVDLLVLKIVNDLGPALMGYITQFSQWVTDHREEIVQFLDEVVKAFVDMVKGAADFLDQLKPLWQAFDSFAKQIGEDGGLHAAFKFILGYVVATWATKMIAAAAGVSSAFGFLAPLMALLAGSTYLANQIAPGYDIRTDPATGMQYAVPKGTGTPEGGATVGGALGRLWNWGKEKLGLGGGAGQSLTTDQQRQNAEESFKFWKSKGLTDAQAAGLVANEIHESRTNPNAVGDGGKARGIFQHHPDRRANILGGTGIDMANASHLEQLQGAWWELNNTEKNALAALMAATTPEEAAAAISLFYERPADAQGQAAARAATAAKYLANRPAVAVPTTVLANAAGDRKPQPLFNVAGKFNGMGLKSPAFTSPSLSGAGTPLLPWSMPLPGAASSVDLKQSTTINVYGGGDPHITAAEVARKQGSLNGALLGNLKGATQ